MVTASVFDQSLVNYFYPTTRHFSKNDIEKESADSKYRENILYQVTFLVFSPKPLVAKS